MSYKIKKIEGVKISKKPCPFCGGKPEWVIVPGEDYILRCSSCHASTEIAGMCPEETNESWENGNIIDDQYTITSDTSIDAYLEGKEIELYFEEYSNIEEFPEIDNGFICSEVVIKTKENILLLESWGGDSISYEEIIDFGKEVFSKSICGDLRFYKSYFQHEELSSIEFLCKEKIIKLIPTCDGIMKIIFL